MFSGGAFTVSAQSDQNFLVVTPASGQTPAAVAVSINTAGLRAGTLSGQVVIAPAGSPSSSATVPVTLNVEAPPAPQLQVSPPQFSLNAVQGAAATHLQLAVLNAGGGTLNFTAQLRFLSGTNWASLDSTSGTATFAAPRIGGHHDQFRAAQSGHLPSRGCHSSTRARIRARRAASFSP